MSLPATQCEPSDASTMAMRDVADRIGNELAELAGAIHRLQVLISPLLNEAALRNPVHLQELQDIDHIYQKVGDLAEFLAALALTLPKGMGARSFDRLAGDHFVRSGLAAALPKARNPRESLSLATATSFSRQRNRSSLRAKNPIESPQKIHSIGDAT